jgi:hypothetical protein
MSSDLGKSHFEYFKANEIPTLTTERVRAGMHAHATGLATSAFGGGQHVIPAYAYSQRSFFWAEVF